MNTVDSLDGYEYCLMEEDFIREQMDNDILKIGNAIDNYALWLENDACDRFSGDYKDIIDEQIDKLQDMKRKM